MPEVFGNDAPPTDLCASGKFALSLGETIDATAPSELYTSVRYNHKPADLDLENVETLIARRESRLGATTLTVKDDLKRWTYDGFESSSSSSSSAGAQTYILLRKDDDSYTIERLAALHRYKLTSTPDESDPARLATQYPPLPDDDTADDESEGELDVNNPFDYRNHLETASPRKATPPRPQQPQVRAPPHPKTAAVAPTPVDKRAQSGTPKTKAAGTTAAKAKAKVRDPNAPPPRRGRPPKDPHQPPKTSTKVAAAAPTAAGGRATASARPAEVRKQGLEVIQTDREPEPSVIAEAGDDDDDGDLEAEMLAAMEQEELNEASVVQPTPAVPEEEEESEEE